ncbi:MAG: hypothetical protein HYZ63_02555 [Candidatus Andersenbacteria bacterium]|nr:hypothetical protein [Candidatus Andersenbacteria bacterium]
MEKQLANNSLPDEEIRKLVIARLKVLSSDTSISIGSDGSFSRDELIDKIETDDPVGRKFEQIELEWLRSWKANAYGGV